MKKTIITLSIVVCAILSRAQVGMSCQYFPGLQVGFVSVKTQNFARYGGGTLKYKYGAGLPLLLVDRVKNHWYTLLDFSAMYYGATQTNKANDNRVKISKAEGGVIASRLGYVFGKGDQARLGPLATFGYSYSNLDSTKKTFDFEHAYYNFGLGVVGYKKFGKFRVVGKIGYEIYKKKDYITGKAHGMFFEGTLGYSFYQKYGLSVMPCLYTKKFAYTPSGGNAADGTTAKVRSFVLRIGLTRFF